jgi:hypothetical protein
VLSGEQIVRRIGRLKRAMQAIVIVGFGGARNLIAAAEIADQSEHPTGSRA